MKKKTPATKGKRLGSLAAKTVASKTAKKIKGGSVAFKYGQAQVQYLSQKPNVKIW